MQLVSYLNFNGECREAFEFYRGVFGGELAAMVTMEDMGIPDLDEASKSLILHARLIMGDQTLMGSDVSEEVKSPPAPVQVSIQVDSVEEAERIYSAMVEGGNIMIPLDEQEWALRFGFFEDRYGIPWMVYCEGSA